MPVNRNLPVPVPGGGGGSLPPVVRDPRTLAVGLLLEAVLDRVFGGDDGPAAEPQRGSREIRAADSFRAGAADFESEMARQELLEDKLHAAAFLDDDEILEAHIYDLEGRPLIGGHHHHHHRRCRCGDC